MRRVLILILLLGLCDISYPQTPRIKWWFDTKDASFGQTAAGDIDGDGKLELVFGCYRNDSSVYALNAEDGSLLWKVNTSPAGFEGCNDVAPLIFDVDGDGNMEVIVPSSCNPTTFCFDGKTGLLKWKAKTRGSDSPPTIADIDGDGKPEILHGEFGGYVLCINAEDGSVAWEIPVDTRSWIQTAPTLVDLDGNGRLDFVVATWNRTAGDTNRVYAYRSEDHSPLWRYPLTDVVYHGTAVSDLDRDGKPELVIGDYSGTLSVLNGEDGSLAWQYKYPSGYYIGAPASIADLDGDGRCDIVTIGWFKVTALRFDGSVMWEHNIDGYPSAFRGAALADIDNDAKPDVVFGTSKGKLVALTGMTGSVLWSVDLAAHYGNASFELNHAPVIADFDGDDTLDVFIVGGHAEYPNFQNDFGRAYALSIGKGSGPDWLMFQNNPHRTGSLCGGVATAISEIPHAFPFAPQVYPIPADDFLHVETHGLTRVDIMDAVGRLCESIIPSDEHLTIDVRTYPPGMYLMRLIAEKGIGVRRFIRKP